MRKELLVFIPTFEQNEEISVTSVAKNRTYVLLNTPLGRVTAHREELIEALNTINEFDKANNTESKQENLVANIGNFVDIKYGSEE